MTDYNKVKPRRTYDANRVPLVADLEEHECAINWTDGRIFVRHNNEIVSYTFGGGSSGGSGSGGNASIISHAVTSEFPATGDSSALYVATDTRRLYGWDATNSVYVELGPIGGGGGSGGGGSDLASIFVPPAPTSLTASAGNAQVSLSWTAPSVLAQLPITDYIVQYKAASASTWNTFSDGTSTSTSATVTGLTNGTAYVFRVAAVNAAGTGAFTAASSGVTPASSISVAYLVVAGGGGGGAGALASYGGGGGGGAGGYRCSFQGDSSGGGASAESLFAATAGVAYSVVVGAGGSGIAMSSSALLRSGYQGSSSSFASISATGGGGGAGADNSGGVGQATTGGSGGGGSPATVSAGAAGTAGQGYAGGNGESGLGGGGGGAGGLGVNAAGGSAAAGGVGVQSSINGTPTYRAGGGGGASGSSDDSLGGLGGGGVGTPFYNAIRRSPGSGQANTGGGGGALPGFWYGWEPTSGSGGSGVVILRSPVAAASTTGSPTVTTVSGEYVYTFTGSGSITF